MIVSTLVVLIGLLLEGLQSAMAEQEVLGASATLEGAEMGGVVITADRRRGMVGTRGQEEAEEG